MVGFFGVAEDDLPEVGSAVVDLGAVAFHNQADYRHHRFELVGNRRGRSPALDKRVGIAGVLHEKEQLTFGLGVKEKCAGANVGLVGDLLSGDLINTMLGEKLTGGGCNAVELGLLVPLASSDRLRGD